MNILLVENDFYIRELVTEVLTEYDFIVEAVSNGSNILQLVKKRQYDLIILDIVLPKPNGIDLCCQLRAHGYYMPIIFWTSQDLPEFRQAGLQAGADDYLPKPCKIRTFLKRINNLLNAQPIESKAKINFSECEGNYLQVA